MVFDWFQRGADQPGEPQPTPSPQIKAENPTGSSPQQAPGSSPNSSPDTVPAPMTTPTSSPEDEALVWAREAYARLKAQQQASESVSVQQTPPEPSPEPNPEPSKFQAFLSFSHIEAYKISGDFLSITMSIAPVLLLTNNVFVHVFPASVDL